MVTLFSFLLLGFFLGMRHATDADHVVAVSTIVSRERTVRNAALIGIFWGIGHTLTLLLVGGAIVLFGLVIPPRLGLSLELSVALMLILLGLLNLKSFTRWIRQTARADVTHGREICHNHPHQHGDHVHTHPHGHEPGAHGHREEETPTARLDRRWGRLRLYQALRPLIVGVV